MYDAVVLESPALPKGMALPEVYKGTDVGRREAEALPSAVSFAPCSIVCRFRFSYVSLSMAVLCSAC